MTSLWVTLALVSTLFFSIASFVDKYILSKKFTTLSAPGYVALAGLSGLPFVCVLAGMASDSLATTSNVSIALGALAGVTFSGGFGLYIKALMTSETSVAASLFQLTVVWNLVLGFIFLHETPPLVAIIGMVVLGVGSLALARETDLDSKRITRFDTLLLMVAACLLISLSDVLFKLSADKGSYLTTQFSEYSASIIVGMIILLLSRRTRLSIASVMQARKAPIISILLLNEVANLGAITASRLSIVHLDIAVAQAIMGVQPLLLIAIGYVLTRLAPHTVSEVISRRHLGVKFGAAALMLVAEMAIILAVTR